MNVHEELARRIKAEKIVRVLREVGADLITAEQMGKKSRKQVAVAAQVNVPSDETWALVLDMMRADAKKTLPPGRYVAKVEKVVVKMDPSVKKARLKIARVVVKHRETLEYFRMRTARSEKESEQQLILEEILMALDELEEVQGG